MPGQARHDTMQTVLIILGIGAVLGLIFRDRGSGVVQGAASGAAGAGFCMLQLLIPVLMLLAGFWLFGAIFG